MTADLDRIERELIWCRSQLPLYVVDDDVAALLAEVRSLRRDIRLMKLALCTLVEQAGGAWRLETRR